MVIDSGKAVKFYGTQLRQVTRELYLENTKNEINEEGFCSGHEEFVGNKKVQVYADFVTKMLIDLKYLGYNVTIKMH